ncbi:MAG TPA: FAD-binding oxidoreductase, partial [Polyangiales bacterium]
MRARAARRVDRAVRELTLDAPVIEGALRKLDSTLSLHSIRARVIEVRQETHDVKTFVLRPNARFESFKPGSYVNIKVRVGGRRHSRSYSISSSPTHRRAFSITVKRVPG